ncbi:oligoendopeptidase F [Spiroplasma helicoides]|nr:oligoendopeptidase F [Spiroplasma helicoides]
MKRNKAQDKYKWDFSHLYKNSQEFKNDLILLKNKLSDIENMKGKLNDKNTFLSYLTMQKDVSFMLAKLNQYTHLYDVDQTNAELQELNSLLQSMWQEFEIKTSFVEPEIIEIGEQKLLEFIKNSEFESHTHSIKKVIQKAKHILNEEQEKLLSEVERSRSATAELYDTLSYADKQEKEILINNNKVIVDTTFFRNFMQDSDPINDQENRKLVWDAYFENVNKRKYSFAKIYESILLKQVENYKIRNYQSTLEMSLFNDSVPTEIYEELLRVGKNNIQILKNYYLMIKEKYGLKKFYSTDRELKLTKEFKKTFNVDEAVEIVKDSLSVLGEEYQSNLEIALRDNAIDYYEDTSKRTGAYSSGGFGVQPIILMNWDDKLSSLSTLTHELGHSVHTLLSEKEQPYPLDDYPIILAEVASTFNEHVLFDYLYNKVTDKDEKIYLIQQRIFDIVSTFYRQIQFAEFEYLAHKLVEKDEPLTSDILMELFKKVEMSYGYDIFDDKDREVYHWPYISHFFGSPYYVYKYAIDIVASYKLYDDFKQNGPESILKFLKSGGKKDPLDILKDCGVDFLKEETYTPLIREVENLTTLLKTLI